MSDQSTLLTGDGISGWVPYIDREELRMSKNANSFDVVIFGSGVASVACCLCLLRLGRHVALLTHPVAKNVPVGETLSPQCSLLLSQMGIWQQFLAQNPLQSTSVRVAWTKPYPEEQDYSFHPCGAWWHVDHAAFRNLLLNAARAAGACEFGVRDVELLRSNHRGWVLELLDFAGERCSIRSSVIVDATGRSASIARKNGAHRKRYDNLIAISGVVGIAEKMKPDQIFTLIESTHSGWWYSSVASTRTLVGTFMTDGPLSGQSLKCYWKSQLAKSQFTHTRFIDSIEAASVRCLSAATMKTEPIATPTLFTVGDAAMTHDPLSSHGIQKALTSGHMAGVAINDTLRGKASSASEYSRRLEADFEQYLRLRSRYYSRVGRFQGSSFWNTRREQHPTG